MFKLILGNFFFNRYEKHLEKSLKKFVSPEDEEKYNNYFSFGIGRFKYDIILNIAKQIAQDGNYSKCYTVEKANNMHNYYEYGYIYKRVCEGKNLKEKIKILFS